MNFASPDQPCNTDQPAPCVDDQGNTRPCGPEDLVGAPTYVDSSLSNDYVVGPLNNPSFYIGQNTLNEFVDKSEETWRKVCPYVQWGAGTGVAVAGALVPQSWAVSVWWGVGAGVVVGAPVCPD